MKNKKPIAVTALRYLAALSLTALVCVTATFLFNAAVDPLWYFSGNTLKSVNFAFNERLSKVNLIAGHENEYDCVIFGDSRVTLLPEQKITNHHCFNFAFSAGTINEFVSYAKWLKARGLNPDLVIVGVSAGDFRQRKPPHNVPAFIKNNSEPQSPFIKYLSLDVAYMSWRTIFGTTPIDRTYDRNFRCRVAITTKYDPHVPIRDLYVGPFDLRTPLDQYRALRAIFPDARFVGYTPPISAFAIAEYARIHWLESYTHALHDAATVFDRFIDTSVPSDITIEPANTYDGTHYSSKVNAIIAAHLLSGRVAQAINLKKMSASKMLSIYKARLAHYAPELAAVKLETSALKD